ncbi:prepilin-type N-terminal cleavage/methylation domain-containing protein [Myxococcota bacterium]|nr:prepilin-type N-terminal cleavage/methylation domain-containing protein [Myxococcota bacterium]
MSRRPPRDARGFTLLEVLVSVSILAISLTVLIGAQLTAVRMLDDSRDVVTATMLARDVMTRVELYLEERGFGETELTESGDFKSDYPGEFDDFEWEYSVAPIDLDLGNVQGLLAAFSGGETEGSETEQVGAAQDLGDLPIDLSMFDEQIARYIRAIEVTVRWKRAEHAEEITLVTHAVNPSGRVSSGDEEEIGGLPSLSGGGGGPTTGGGSGSGIGGDK